MGHAGGRAHIPGHISCCPLQWSHDTLPDHQFQIVVFHALHLMVPLLKRHFCLSQHGFTTESVNMKGTKSQSSGQCIYETSYIFMWLSGSRGQRGCPLEFQPPPWKHDLLVIHIRVPVSCWISPGSQQWVPGGTVSSPRETSQQRSSMSCLSSASPRSTWNWCGVLPPE